MSIFKNVEASFELSDKAGRFLLKRESGRMKGSSKYLVKEEMLLPNGEKEPVERLASVSAIGEVKKLKLLRPEKSEYSVWFDGIRYRTKMNVDIEDKKMIVVMDSPESEWSGEREFDFPNGTGVYCFYSQVIECASITGFIDKAISEKTGRMSFHIIWEGYPYIMDQYPGIPKEVFTQAQLEYDGKTDEGEERFQLLFAGETIFYLLDKENGRFSKKMWVSQGLTQTPSGSR